jgi:hypothetical protein
MDKKGHLKKKGERSLRFKEEGDKQFRPHTVRDCYISFLIGN